jgi:predicted nucleic acid-binding protein
MCFEAEEITRRAAVNSMYLKKHPDVVKRLLKYNIAMEDLLYRDNLQILDVTPDDVLGSFAVRQKYGLLMKDSITAYLLKKIRIPAIATNDRDFENIEDVQVYRPTDTPSTRNVV